MGKLFTLYCVLSQLRAVVFHWQPLNDVIEHLHALAELVHIDLGGHLNPTEYIESLQLSGTECKPCLQVHLYSIKNALGLSPSFLVLLSTNVFVRSIKCELLHDLLP